MRTFQNSTANAWNNAVLSRGIGSVFMTSAWEQWLADSLPYLSLEHYTYRDVYEVRIARIGNRVISAPFSDGSDVISVSDTPLDLSQFSQDLRATFGATARLRVNERFCPCTGTDSARAPATEHVVSLTMPILPNIRKTLRHVLERPVAGEIVRTDHESDIRDAYARYRAHMRSVANLAMPEDMFFTLARDRGTDVWVLKRGGRICAMAMFLQTGEEVLYALSATKRGADSAGDAHHIVYAALMHYQSNGVLRASLGSTGKDSPLETFKRGWRGDAYRVFEIGGGAHESARTSPLRSLVRFVPLPLYESFSKVVGKYVL